MTPREVPVWPHRPTTFHTQGPFAVCEECREPWPCPSQQYLDGLVAALTAIRDAHSPDPDGGMGYQDGGGYGRIDPACLVCGTSDEYAVPWPCRTRTTADDALRLILEGARATDDEGQRDAAIKEVRRERG